MTEMRPFLALLALLPLGACMDVAGERLAAPLATSTDRATLAEQVPAEAALARLPAEAGAVVAVTERREVERLTQTVALAGDAGQRGTNRITVTAAEHDPATMRRMTEDKVAAELAEELPGLDMRPIGRLASAGGGPLGIASGRAADGTACVYAWQQTVVTPRTGRGGSLFAADDVDLSVRVRLCRKGVDEERLIALVEGLTLRSDVTPRGVRFASGPTGVDALATAGYGATSARAETPRRAVEAPAVRPVTPAKKATAAPVVARAAKPRPSDTPAPASSTPASPAIVAHPIPLPSGG